MTRVAVVDLGSNSTRLLIADVAPDGSIAELDRRSIVTRLGQGVDATGRLAEEAMERVFAALDAYHGAIADHAAEVTVGVLTSAARDASNGADFAAAVRERYGIDARTIPGDQEARLSFLGATSERPDRDHRTVVIDIGGGSTELVVGEGDDLLFHVSTQVGVVRHTERHLHGDPPAPRELAELRAAAAATFAAEVPLEVRTSVEDGIAVAGTATMCAAILQELEPYDPARVHGFTMAAAELEELLARLASVALDERRRTRGLHPDRAPTIVAGVAILLEALAAFGLTGVEVSEHDILRGVAIQRTAS